MSLTIFRQHRDCSAPPCVQPDTAEAGAASHLEANVAAPAQTHSSHERPATGRRKLQMSFAIFRARRWAPEQAFGELSNGRTCIVECSNQLVVGCQIATAPAFQVTEEEIKWVTFWHISKSLTCTVQRVRRPPG